MKKLTVRNEAGISIVTFENEDYCSQLLAYAEGTWHTGKYPSGDKNYLLVKVPFTFNLLGVRVHIWENYRIIIGE